MDNQWFKIWYDRARFWGDIRVEDGMWKFGKVRLNNEGETAILVWFINNAGIREFSYGIEPLAQTGNEKKWHGGWEEVGEIDGTKLLIADKLESDNWRIGGVEFFPCDDTRIEPLCANEHGIIELNGKEYMCLSDNDDFDSYLGDEDGNVYRAEYNDEGKLITAELVAALDSDKGKNCLLSCHAVDMPRSFLEGLPIKYVEHLGVDWNDCYPVTYDADRVVEDIYDSNGSLLWDTGADTDNLVVDDSYDYVRPKTKDE